MTLDRIYYVAFAKLLKDLSSVEKKNLIVFCNGKPYSLSIVAMEIGQKTKLGEEMLKELYDGR